jgi:hypothetical protein
MLLDLLEEDLMGEKSCFFLRIAARGKIRTRRYASSYLGMMLERGKKITINV